MEARIKLSRLKADLEGWKERAKNTELTGITLQDYDEQAAVLLPQIQRLTAQVSTASVNPLISELIGSETPDLDWMTLSLELQREVLRAVATIKVFPAGRGRRNTNVEDRIKIRFDLDPARIA